MLERVELANLFLFILCKDERATVMLSTFGILNGTPFHHSFIRAHTHTSIWKMFTHRTHIDPFKVTLSPLGSISEGGDSCTNWSTLERTVIRHSLFILHIHSNPNTLFSNFSNSIYALFPLLSFLMLGSNMELIVVHPLLLPPSLFLPGQNKHNDSCWLLKNKGPQLFRLKNCFSSVLMFFSAILPCL